ncbi:MAG: hypothetical protein NPIRA02_30110 [Nitrospirales bacterium]|nr:MAG: hypothetical protein NPIRA02_30110 [Nitrospirales bacterium]
MRFHLQPFTKFSLVAFALGWLCVTTTTPSFLYAEPSPPSPPPVFQPDETQHGFSQYESIPYHPPSSPDPLPLQEPSGDLDDALNQPPGGLFYRIEFAKGFEEAQGIRKGHTIVSVEPTTVFTPESPFVFLVFHVHQHYAPYQVIGRLYPEKVNGETSTALIEEDAIYLATEDDGGYLQFDRPGKQWPVGDYRVEIYVGFEVNPINMMGTMRFSVAAPSTR